MKTAKETIKFQLNFYLKSNKIIVPFLILFAAVYFIYNQKPQEVVASFNTTSVICFYIMFWIGIGYNDVAEPILEQTMILRLRSARKYYLCNEAVLLIIAVFLSVVSVGYAVLANITNGFDLFTGGLHISDVAGALLLHFATTFAGGMCGSFFHMRIIKDRKILICGAFIFAILAIAKQLIIKDISVMKYVLWLFPPVSEFAGFYRNSNQFTGLSVVKGLFVMCIYGIIITIIKEALLIKNRF